MDDPLVERHSEQILGVLSCFDRVVITGTLPEICHAQAMSAHLRSRGFRIFDYTQFAEPFREQIRGHAERLAAESGLTIEFIQRKSFRKEDRIQEILRTRGEHPGLVHIFSAMEPCSSFKPWHNKQTGQTYLRSTEAKCLHYYFYFILEDLGLCYLRVPTWAPFRLQFYYNGHKQLASQLKKAGIGFHLIDNAFVCVFRAKATTDSSRRRPPIPTEDDHPFQSEGDHFRGLRPEWWSSSPEWWSRSIVKLWVRSAW